MNDNPEINLSNQILSWFQEHRKNFPIIIKSSSSNF